MAKHVILIEGTICAGKTITVEYLKNNKEQFNQFLENGEHVTTLSEFVDPIGVELFYHDRKKYSGIFEDSCRMGKLNRHLKAKEGSGIYIFDRGMIGGAETFSKNSFLEGYLSHDEYEKYQKDIKRGLDQLDRTQQHKWLEQLVVYLRIEDEDVLIARQKQRATPGETITVEYLKKINRMYESFFENIESVYAKYAVKAPKVITIDATRDFNEDKNYHAEILENIVTKMKEMQNGN
ncbi:deoxynucleoside kinase [Candidatus Woesearchaeota archaeon]|jgi:deoxyadenosine/deoxycytidine kinase|nr:deoxynucleoside kinase [Candidatus Woesearchaeota archaeon]